LFEHGCRQALWVKSSKRLIFFLFHSNYCWYSYRLWTRWKKVILWVNSHLQEAEKETTKHFFSLLFFTHKGRLFTELSSLLIFLNASHVAWSLFVSKHKNELQKNLFGCLHAKWLLQWSRKMDIFTLIYKTW